MIELTAKCEWREMRGDRDYPSHVLFASEIGGRRVVHYVAVGSVYRAGGSTWQWSAGTVANGTAPTLELAKAAVEQALKGINR